MKRLLLIALVLASCSKAGKDAAPATGREPPRQVQQDPSAQPPPPPGEGGGGDKGNATEIARNQGGLGVSADTDSFGPIEDNDGSAERRQKQGPAKVEPVVGSSGAPAFVATIETVTVGGKPASAEITQAVKVAGSDIQVCYDKARSTSTKKGDIAGTLKIAFSVLQTGAIGSTTIEGKTLGQFEMENCVMEALSRLKLSKPPADKVAAVVTIKFAKK